MRIEQGQLVWAGIRGRNGADPPTALAQDECAEAYNVVLSDRGGLCQKRYGTLDIPLTSGPSVSCYSVVKHVPSGLTETSAELFALDLGGAITRYSLTGSNYGWSTPSILDAANSVGDHLMTSATLNGKCFLAYDSLVNRLHCWDGTSIRRVGLAVPAAPTVANTGAGAYPATIRYYKVAFGEISGSTHVRRSELSASVSFTPSGGGTAARITRPTAPGEGETHWLLYASADDVYSNFKLVATIAVGTTTLDDGTAPSAYTGDAPQIAGLNMPPPSAKFIISDGNRLLMAGAYETSAGTGGTEPKSSRVWFTRVLGSSGIGDDESIPSTAATGVIPAQKNWIDVGENDGGGPVTGLAIINGVIFVFKRRHVYRLAPTGDDLSPYRSVRVSDSIGCTYSQSLAAGENAAGEPAMYFANQRGVYQMSLWGDIKFVSRQIDDFYAGASTIWCQYHDQRNQLWVGIGTAVAVFDVVREGWTRYAFTGASTHCAVMFPELWLTFANIQQFGTGHLKPLLFGDGDAFQADDQSESSDRGSGFQAYITSRIVFPSGLGKRSLLEDAVLVARAAVGVTMTLTVTGDFAATGQTRTATASLAPGLVETHVVKRFEESAIGAIDAVQYIVGDANVASNQWVLDGMTVPLKAQERRS